MLACWEWSWRYLQLVNYSFIQNCYFLSWFKKFITSKFTRSETWPAFALVLFLQNIMVSAKDNLKLFSTLSLQWVRTYSLYTHTHKHTHVLYRLKIEMHIWYMLLLSYQSLVRYNGVFQIKMSFTMSGHQSLAVFLSIKSKLLLEARIQNRPFYLHYVWILKQPLTTNQSQL